MDDGMGRRAALGLMAGAAVTLAARGGAARTMVEVEVQAPREYTLAPLPYATNALDGYLSAEILELHHGKHHAGYVKGLNDTLAALTEARAKGDYATIKHLERQLAFHGAGHVLHTLYWESMSPKGGGQPTGALAKAITEGFGSADAFRAHFAAATKAAEASGWGILAWEPLGKRLVILAAESHQQMGLPGAVPLLACDVWEHAYYLRYKSDRGTYVDRFFDVIDWRGAGARFDACRT
ncbi:MAG: superoxide dismutase [Fe-Zn] 1 [Myxococcales bacterium]